MSAGSIALLPVSAHSNRFEAIFTNWKTPLLLCHLWMMLPFSLSAAPDLEQEGHLKYLGSIGGRIIDTHQLDDNILAVLLPFGLETYDNRNPQEPVFLSRLNFSRESKSLAVYATTAYIGAAEGVHVVSLANPHSPQEKTLLSAGVDVEVKGPFLRVYEIGKGGRNSLMIYRIDKTPESPLSLGEKSRYDEDLYDAASPTSTSARTPHISEIIPNAVQVKQYDGKSIAWVGSNLLQSFDVSDHLHPDLISSVKISGFDNVSYMMRRGDIIVATSSERAAFINIADPKVPKIISRFSAPDEINAMDYWENIYLFACDSGLVTVDCSSMDAPKQVGFYKTEDRCTGIAAENGMAYVAAKDLLVYRLADPSQLSLVGRLEAPEFEQKVSTVVKYKNILFVPFRVDVSQPSAPASINDSDYQEGGYHLLQKDRVLVGRAGLNYLVRHTRHSFGGDVMLVLKRNSEPATNEPDYMFEIMEGRGLDVSADGLIAVADGAGGLLLLQLNKASDSKSPVLENAHD